MSICSTQILEAVETSANTQTSTRVRTHVLIVALVVILAWAFSLSRSLFDPIGYDQAMYQYMAERIMVGDRLYVDVWDQNGPGIVAIHWISTYLVGRDPVSLRIFDAGWQFLTLVALFSLAARAGRRYLAGWLACGLYLLTYYSLGYVQTAQREGFTVLPILLSIHLVASRGTYQFTRGFLAGALGLFVFTIKPPMGLCFGALWLYAFSVGWRERKHGHPTWPILAGMTLGFLATAGGGVALLSHLGSWQGFWGIITRRDIPGYIQGPRLIWTAFPLLAAGAGTIGLISLGLLHHRGNPTKHECARVSVIATILFGLLVTSQLWPSWQQILTRFIGLWIPALGSILICAWHDREEIWRLCLLMLLASCAALIAQGQFFSYHLPPMLAFAAYIAAIEIDDRIKTFHTESGGQHAWLSFCIAAIISLAVGPWWSTMSMVTKRPYVLSGTTLGDHYTSITKHKLSCPTYATTLKVAHRIQELTNENNPIASLMHEARFYYFARRPSVYKLIAMQEAYRHMFAEYMQAIRSRRPKVLVARIPEALRLSQDLQAIQAAVYTQTETFFGPPGTTIRELYQVVETIDDVCILQPK